MWTCPNCGETMEDQFEGSCWKCANDGIEISDNTFDFEKSISGLILSTTPFAPGHDIESSLGIVSGMAIVSTGFLNKIESAQDIAIAQMARRSKAKGANGIVGINISYQNIHETLVTVAAFGTAVTLKLAK